MRTIKFRAWDKECEVMVYSDKHNHKDYDCDYWFDINNENVYCMWSEDYDDICGFTETRSGELDNIMQYTGLKDKNGKEIYEGDIFKYDEVRDDDGYILDSEEYVKVEWVEELGGFHIVNVNDEPYCTVAEALEDDLYVIGNIYENPELMND